MLVGLLSEDTMYTKNRDLKQLGVTIAVVLIITIAFAAQASAANDPEVSVRAPDWTITAFDATIMMEYFDDDYIKDLEGEFDLSFDTDVVSVVSVTGMKIKTKVVPIEWEFVEGSDNKKIHVEFIIPDDTGTRTYGEFVKIQFNLVGDRGDSSLLDISGSLADKDGTAVSAKWTDDTVNIESFDVEVNAPEFVSTDTFDAEIDITDVVDLNCGSFDLSFDPGVVNVTDVKPGTIGGATIPIEGWTFEKSDMIRVIFKLPGDNGVSGSGTLATVNFDVIGEDGDSSVLDIVEKSSDTVISNTESDGLPVNWIDATVTINSEAPPPPNETDTYVYVKNLDDDKLTVFLFIDGNFIIDKDVSSGSTKKYSNYKLLEGLHTFKIKWYDLDTEAWYEQTTEYSVSGETDLVVINTVEHTAEDTRISAQVYVKNNDDDPLVVYLHIDDTYKKCETIEAEDTCDYEDAGYEFDEEESHTFMIRWRDPDTDVEYEKLIRKYIKSEESIMIYIDPHTEDDLITTASIPTSSSAPQSSSTSSSAPATSAGSGTVESSPTTTSTTPITVLHTDPVSAGSNESGAGQSQSQYHHLYTLVGAIAIITAVTQIRRG